MAKWLIHGDPHLKASNIIQAKEFFNWIDIMAIKHEVAGVINLGDTFDTHAVVRSEILGEYRNYLNTRGNYAYFHILGNHEQFRPHDSHYHALQPFLERKDDKYYVIDKPMIIEGMGFVPFCAKAEDFPNLGSDAQIVFAHQTFLGADFGKFRPEDGVDATLLPHVRIYSGHIHTKQVIDNVFYPGSPIPYGINDADQVKGITIFDDETLDEKFIQSPFPGWRTLTIDLSVSKPLEVLVSSINRQDNWVVDIVGPKLEVAEFIDSKEVTKIRKEIKLRLRAKVTDATKEKVSIKAISISGMIDEYIDKIYAGSLNRGELKDSMKGILDGF